MFDAKTIISAVLVTGLVALSCTRHEIVEYVPPTSALVALTISDVQGLEEPTVFDRVQVEIQGFEWSVIATVSADFADGKATLLLPSLIAAEQLCKVARDNYEDYTGFWPATQVSDRTAGVAGLGDIVAYRGQERIGRLYLTGWDGVPANKHGACFVYFCYQDRPYTLSGSNLTSPGSAPRFSYNASFTAGWKPYYHKYNGSVTTVSTTQPPDTQLVWRFERW